MCWLWTYYDLGMGEKLDIQTSSNYFLIICGAPSDVLGTVEGDGDTAVNKVKNGLGICP